MDLVTLMNRLGGIGRTAELLAHVERPDLEAAVADGSILRLARGRYVLPTASEGQQAAHRLTAVAALRTAAASYGWKLKSQPERPELIVPRGRRVSAGDQTACSIRWRRVAPEERNGWRTSPIRTVIDCATTLPFDEALAVADSALRAQHVTANELFRAADALPGRGRDRALDLTWHASGKAANPFESVIRAISIDVPGLKLRPQVRLKVAGRRIRPDLLDDELRIIVEGDSHEFHTSRDQIDMDCWRYDELVLDDWLVLRVSWVQAMFRQPWVASVMERAVIKQARRHCKVTLVKARAFAMGRTIAV
jgi:hypothetical protein